MKKSFKHWQTIFEAKQFDTQKDLHTITAQEIKDITGYEPRLISKMDSLSDVPPVFKQFGYFLLPIKNGAYAIVRGDGFHQLEEQSRIVDYLSQIRFPLETANRGQSEMQFLDYAYNTGAIGSVLGIDSLYLTIRGREYCREFDFFVNTTSLHVASVQIEVDAGYESKDSLVLIEAKVSNPEDFIIRQLYYPYRNFQKIPKKIIPVFFTYEPVNKIFNFWIYEFRNPQDYNSIELKNTTSLRIVDRKELELKDLVKRDLVIYKDLIPQANDVDKIIRLVFKVDEGVNDAAAVAEYFGFDKRQSSYYREAAEALGLIKLENSTYHLTDLGRYFVNLPVDKRNKFFTELLLGFDLVSQSIDLLERKGDLTFQDLAHIVDANSNLSGSTIPRRAGSLKSWLAWIAKSTGVFTFAGGKFVRNNQIGLF